MLYSTLCNTAFEILCVMVVLVVKTSRSVLLKKSF